MKQFVFGLLRIAPAIVLLMSGCELSTPPAGAPRGKVTGDDLVLNEVFTVSPDKYYAYSWLELFNPTDHSIPWVDDVFPINTYALGSGGTLIHNEELDVDSWQQAVPGSGQTYNNLDFYYPDTAFACGNGGLLQKIKGDDFGNFTVEDLTSGTTRNINDCQFAYTSAVGYMVCDGGEIRRSLNRGVSWTLQTSGVTQALRNLAFVEFGSPPRIWTCGDSGRVLRKAPVGALWTIQTVPADKATMNFYAMTFTVDSSIEHGIAVGQAGTIITSRNGGANWASKTSGVTSTLRSVYMANDPKSYVLGRAWAVGDNGTILRTDNYGDTWTHQSSGTSAKLNKVVFGDSIRGASFGDGGTVLNTTDGGRTWRAQNSRTTENLVGANTLPLSIKVEKYYVVEMLAKRKTFFVDFATGAINYDYYTKIDTGIMTIDPQGWFNQRFTQSPPGPIPAYTFLVVINDSARFKDHVKLGPGNTYYGNLTVTFQDTTFPPHPIKWDLLSAGEVRIVKYYKKRTVGGNSIVLGFTKKIIEIMRYGNFYPTVALYPPDEQGNDQLFLSNQPLGFIPEGYSISRYANDGGGTPVEQQSTVNSFYLSSDPIPGWFSQESRP